MSTIKTRLRQIEERFPAPPPLDLDAALEFGRTWNASWVAIAETIPEEFQHIIQADLDAHVRGEFSQITDVFIRRVEAKAQGCILPLGMPAALCQALIDHPDLAWHHDCADCGASIPLARVIGGAPKRIFESCFLCGGTVGYAAYSRKDLSTETLYGGRFLRYWETKRAAWQAIHALGEEEYIRRCQEA